MEGPLRPPVGLCARCRHARRITSARGSEFWMCARSARDARYPKYPRLPVVSCEGFEPPEREEPED